MENNSIPGKCPQCNKEMLLIVGERRNYSDWRINYIIECALCEYQFSSDKETLDGVLRLWKNQKKNKGTHTS